MKELNVFLDKLDKECPHAINKIEKYGKGKIIQVIIGDMSSKEIEVKEDKEPGVYYTKESNVEIYEVLYKNNRDKKKNIVKALKDIKQSMNNKIIFVSCLSQTKSTVLLQLYALDEVNRYKAE